jgi:23S rRNA (guanosine2251-2'-O)-methyltransferase
MAYTPRPGRSGQSETKASGRSGYKPGPGTRQGRGSRQMKEERESRPASKSTTRPSKSQPRPASEADRQASRPLEDELPYLIMGRNGVREALRSGRSIDRILVTKEQDGSLGELVNMARDRNIQLREVDRAKLDELCMPFGHGNKPGNHQGIVAQVPGVDYCEVEDILAVAKARGEAPFLILLDGIEDPHNLGSILRSAECAGAHGVILPKRRSASLTAAACKASAGAVEYIKVARVANLVEAMRRLKRQGIWLAGADMQGAPMDRADLKGPLGLVIGSEGSGLGKLVQESCDFLVSIPMSGHLDSLNAAVAAAILMFEKKRQG